MSPSEQDNAEASTPEATPRLHWKSVQQAQAVQQRLKHAVAPSAPSSAPSSFGQVPNSSKAHRRERHLASVQMKLVIFALFFCISAERPSLAAAASRCRRPRSGQQPRHKDQERANMLITGRRRRRPRRGIIPQAKSAQQRLKHSSAPPSYCRVPCSSKVHRCEGHLATTQMK